MNNPISLLNKTRFMKRFIFSKLAKRLPIHDAADKISVLCEAEFSESKPAIALQGQLDKVQGVSPYTTFEQEKSRAIGGKIKHEATKAFHFYDATLIGGTVFCKHYKHRISPPKNDFFFGNVREVDTAALVSSFVGTVYFGHWLRDDMITYELARNMAVPLSVSSAAQPETLARYSNIFDQNWEPSGVVHAKEVIIYSDYAQNSLKQKRYRLLREKMRKIYPANGSDKRVFLRRGSTGARRYFQNENQIAEHLASRGFIIADVESDSIDEILTKLNGAQLIISVEGSQISHCVYTLAEGGAVLVIQPPSDFNNVHKGWLEAIGCRYAYVVCDPTADGFHLDPDDLDATLELIDKSV